MQAASTAKQLRRFASRVWEVLRTAGSEWKRGIGRRTDCSKEPEPGGSGTS